MAQSSRSSPAYKRYMLGVLVVVLALNYIDRFALGLMLQDIKRDLQLSDTQLGLLTGLAFAFFYSIMGLPIARWADRGNRVTIITLTTGLWSLAVACCGAAGNFAQLLLMRICVAVGEAGCVPPAHSLIADHFDRSQRARAAAIYMLGVPLSMLIGYLAAGWLNQMYGWRITFLLIGLPGLVVAPIVWLTLKEPRKAQWKRAASPEASPSEAAGPLQASVRETCTTLWRNKTFLQLALAFAIMSFFGQGAAQWKPAFFARSFHLETGELGTWLALIYGGGGILGTWIGGEFAARIAANDEGRQLRLMGLAYAGFAVFSCAVYVSTNLYFAFAFLALATISANLIFGPFFAIIQTLVPSHMRATSIAIVYLVANLIGMGLGPLMAGALSDAYRALHGEESLRFALVTMSPGFLWAAWHLWVASKSVGRDVALTAETEPQAAE